MDVESANSAAIAELINTITQAKNFVVAEAPAYCQEYLLWQRYQFAIAAAVAFFSGILFTLLLRKGLRDEKNNSVGGPTVVSVVVSGAVCCLSLVCTVAESVDAIQSVVAPKVMLVEHLKQLLK
jgi:hypothetical protein